MEGAPVDVSLSMHAAIVCRWTMFAISTIFRVNTIYCNTIQHRLHRMLGERNSFDGVPRDRDAPSHGLGISHVINLCIPVCCAISFHYIIYIMLFISREYQKYLRLMQQFLSHAFFLLNSKCYI